jgi:hypothetical protein
MTTLARPAPRGAKRTPSTRIVTSQPDWTVGPPQCRGRLARPDRRPKVLAAAPAAVEVAPGTQSIVIALRY